MLPGFSQPFILETDASSTGTGVILSQARHLIALFSQKLGPRIQNQPAYVRESCAIIEALAKFRQYLMGHKFITRKNQKSLKEILEQTLQTPEQ